MTLDVQLLGATRAPNRLLFVCMERFHDKNAGPHKCALPYKGPQMESEPKSYRNMSQQQQLLV